MRDHFAGFFSGKAAIHRSVEVEGHLRDLARGDEGAYRGETAIPRREGRPEPQLLEQHVSGIVHKTRRYWAHGLLDDSGA
jgi:hypothetical protein